MTDGAKARLRLETRERRRSIDPETRAAASLALHDRVLGALPRLRLSAGAVIAGYRAIRDEIDPEPTLLALAARGYGLALPASLDKGSPLEFRAWRSGDPLQPDHLGVPAPLASAPRTAPALILVPLLAFDRAGHRLGYGAGCYDRTLAAVRAARPVLALGLAFALQEVPMVPAAAHDSRLDGVVTERAVFWFDSKDHSAGRA